MTGARWGALALQLALATALAAVVGLGLGWLSRSFYVIGLWTVLIGVAAGAAIAFVATLTGGPWRGGARVVLLVAVVAGWLGTQTMEDYQFRALFAARVAHQRAVGDALPPELLRDDDALAFLGRSADTQLAERVRGAVGRGGPLGRWLYRADRGVRLVGPMEGGRGLAVGRGGAIAWAVVQVLLAIWLGALVLRRAEARARLQSSNERSDRDASVTAR